MLLLINIIDYFYFVYKNVGYNKLNHYLLDLMESISILNLNFPQNNKHSHIYHLIMILKGYLLLNEAMQNFIDNSKLVNHLHLFLFILNIKLFPISHFLLIFINYIRTNSRNKIWSHFQIIILQFNKMRIETCS